MLFKFILQQYVKSRIETQSKYPSPPVWWSWCRGQRSSRLCSCRWTGSPTPSHCWWWVWRGHPRPRWTVCSAPLCTSPAAFPSPSPTRSPSMPRPEIRTTGKKAEVIVLGHICGLKTSKANFTFKPKIQQWSSIQPGFQSYLWEQGSNLGG